MPSFSAHACAGNSSALCLIFRTAEQDTITHIGLHLPHVGGMRLKDVNGIEPNLVPVLLGQLIQGGNLPPKRRSGVAAKDQDDWLFCPQ